VARSWSKTTQGNKKLVGRKVRSEAVTGRVFEELFNTSMLGSRWLDYTEIEALHQTTGILRQGEKIIIHAQEYSGNR
jgi:hypothetical protein